MDQNLHAQETQEKSVGRNSRRKDRQQKGVEYGAFPNRSTNKTHRRGGNSVGRVLGAMGKETREEKEEKKEKKTR